jgi:hypothetical protein
MQAELREHAAFYLTGKRSDTQGDAVAELGMRPALLAGYRDLTALRYDFPIVLPKDSPEGSIAEPLSVLIDRALDEAAVSKDDGERLRIHALKLERELRSMAARGVGGSLLALLDLAARHLESGGDAVLLADSVRRLRCDDARASAGAYVAGCAADQSGCVPQAHRPLDFEADRDPACGCGTIRGGTHTREPAGVGRCGLRRRVRLR